jgi:lipopolysaccharide export LptBFGC system permease protein LptF
LVFLLLGGAFLLGGARQQFRAVPSIWLLGHALFHLWEVAVGICSPSVIPRDFPAVTLPAIIAAILTVWAIRQSRGGGVKTI